jgi:hypothetical protein
MSTFLLMLLMGCLSVASLDGQHQDFQKATQPIHFMSALTSIQNQIRFSNNFKHNSPLYSSILSEQNFNYLYANVVDEMVLSDISPNISQSCLNELEIFAQALKNKTLWSLTGCNPNLLGPHFYFTLLTPFI